MSIVSLSTFIWQLITGFLCLGITYIFLRFTGDELKHRSVKNNVFIGIFFALSVIGFIETGWYGESPIKTTEYDHGDVIVVTVEDKEYNELVNNYLSTDGKDQLPYKKALKEEYTRMLTLAETNYLKTAKDYSTPLLIVNLVFMLSELLLIIFYCFVFKKINVTNDLKETLTETKTK